VFRALTSPRMIGLHLLALVATTAAAWLGLWQYDAWATRRDLAARDLANAEPKALAQVMSSDDPFPGDAIGQPVQLRGTWLPDETFFVADREQQGQRGYWVVTPVAVCQPSACEPSAPALLVVRGWAPRPQQTPQPPTGQVEVTGWLQPPEGSGRQDPDPADDVLQEVRIADAIQRMDQDLYGAYVIARDLSPAPPSDASGLVPITPDSLPEPETFTAFRNLLYAAEWWVFGGFAVFIWWRWCSDEIKQARSSEGARTAEVASSP
jgi:surfeit locus 1 family protein